MLKEISMKEIINKFRMVGTLLKRIYRTRVKHIKPFRGSTEYWKRRYEKGGNSGDGSYNELAEFKADVLNSFVQENNIETVIEYGCGDGNQLRLAEYPSYIGFDVSPVAISCCNKIFSDDKTKHFKLMDEYAGEIAQLTLSLDVIYHLIEDNIFIKYMGKLFSSSTRFVIIYSSNNDDNTINRARHVKHRQFSGWIEETQPQWKLLRFIKNKYPYAGDNKKGSMSDFFIYERV
jgi:hypothetical protein